MKTIKTHTVKETTYFNELKHFTVTMTKKGSEYSVYLQNEGEAKKIDDAIFYCGGGTEKQADKIYNFHAFGKMTIKGL